SEAEKRIQEEQPDQSSPEAAADRTRCRHAYSLMQSYLALLVLDGHDRVFQIDQVVLPHLHESETDLLGLEWIVIFDDHQCAHACPPLPFFWIGQHRVAGSNRDLRRNKTQGKTCIGRHVLFRYGEPRALPRCPEVQSRSVASAAGHVSPRGAVVRGDG